MPPIGLPLNLDITNFVSLVLIWWLFCGLEETISKTLALEFVGLVVDGKARQVSILDAKSCILSYQILQLGLIQESHYLIVLSVNFVQLHCFCMGLVSICEADSLVQIHLRTL